MFGEINIPIASESPLNLSTRCHLGKQPSFHELILWVDLLQFWIITVSTVSTGQKLPLGIGLVSSEVVLQIHYCGLYLLQYFMKFKENMHNSIYCNASWNHHFNNEYISQYP